MWSFITTILYVICVHANQPANGYPQANNERAGYPDAGYQQYRAPPARNPNFLGGAVPLVSQNGYIDELYNENRATQQANRKSDNYNNNFRETPILDLEYAALNVGANPSDTLLSNPETLRVVEQRGSLNSPSYFEDLELTENFAQYLKSRTHLNSPSGSINDAAHQFNALLAVIITLARIVRDSCNDFEKVYDQVYLPNVETYYANGQTNAHEVHTMIEDYVRRGKTHMSKIKKLKQEICEKELFCSRSFDSYIKSSPLIYAKELETLEALAHLARSFYSYIAEFDEAAASGTVLPYLQNNKGKLKNYIMHVVNSVEHLSDTQVMCS